MLGRGSDVEFHDSLTDEDCNRVCIVGNKLFSAGTLRVNYTTYDVCREQNTVNPHTHPFVMVKSGKTTKNVHPFWYAQVLGMFHASVLDTDVESTVRSPQHVEFFFLSSARLLCWSAVRSYYTFRLCEFGGEVSGFSYVAL